MMTSPRKTMEKSMDTDNSLESGNQRKIMEKVSFMWVIDNYSDVMQRGVPIPSEDLVDVGGFQFRIILYPRGKSETAQQEKMMSICIRNESIQVVDVVYSFEICHQYGLPYLELRRSLFHDRGLFHRVMTLPPNEEVGIIKFLHLSTIEGQRHSYVRGNNIKLVATVGVFVNPPHNVASQPLDRLIFFQVQDKRYYAEESVIRRRCPALCANNSEFPNFILENIEPDTFNAILYFIYKKSSTFRIKKDICTSDVSDPNSLGVRMLRAARRYRLDLLKETCESIIFYGSLEMHDFVFPIRRFLRRAWRMLRGR